MGKESVRLTVLLAIGIIFLLLSFSTILIVTFWFGNRKLEEFEEFEEEEFFNYQYLEYDESKDLSSIGIVSLPRKLGEYEYISTSRDVVHTLISNFGETEYKCTGTCFCEDDRRSTKILSSRPVMYLLTAVSTSLAYVYARNHFNEICQEEFSDHTSSCAIKSEVNNCEKEMEEEEDDGFDYNPQKRQDDGNKEFEKDAWKKSKNYLCQGHCMTNKEALNEGYAIRAILDDDNPAKEINCNDLEKDAYVYIDPDFLRVEGDEVETARWIFQETYMKPYCQDMSAVYDKVQYLDEKGEKRTLSMERFLCLGAPDEPVNGNIINPKIFCRKTNFAKDMEKLET